ncbi:hypothetical protein BC351_16080 [Paenibacillus ferrarius]|uniref:Uncharacterized protein n=1 Tax=Paenibacillus ferrarius TaxID=1469647 RepID=A0A1V4HRT0_9BACL|nr:hypothetical protein BC351_16080 [Paenibacillus ferrarius]
MSWLCWLESLEFASCWQIGLRRVHTFRIIPAIMHLFRRGNKQNSEKPANMHPFETFFRFLNGKAYKACIIAGILYFHAI